MTVTAENKTKQNVEKKTQQKINLSCYSVKVENNGTIRKSTKLVRELQIQFTVHLVQ